MTRGVIAGEIIVDRLRDRIVSGVFLGKYKPGERLPSVRDIAELEDVDRKTAAAAYRRLQKEGLVRIRARSGVYLRERGLDDPADPLQRLHRRWLEKTYEGARSLGIDTPMIARLVDAVIQTERLRVPVVEADWSQATALAAELRRRSTVRAVPYLLSEIDPEDPVLAAAPFLITTPYQSPRLRAIAGERPVLQVVLSRPFLDGLAEEIRAGALILVPSEPVARRVRRALQRLDDPEPPRVAVLQSRARERTRIRDTIAGASRVFLWLGTPRYVAADLREVQFTTIDRTIAETSITRIRQAILDHAIRHVVPARVQRPKPRKRTPPGGRRGGSRPAPIRGPEAA